MTSALRTPQQLLGDALTPAGKRDPHLIYDQIRAQTPIWRDEHSGMWYLFRWSDCTEVFRSKQFAAPDLLKREPRFASSPSLQFLADTLSNLDPPDHTRLRSKLQRSFSAPVLRRSEVHVQEVIAAAIAALRDRKSFDVVADFAALIPNTVICELLGVPRADHSRFAGWLADQFRLLSPVPPTNALLDEVDISTKALVAYMGDLIEEKRRSPRADILSEMVKMQAGDAEPMSLREMTVTSSILLAGGSDTSKTGISIGVRSLLEHRDQLAMLLADATLEASMFEEVLRTGGAVLLANLRRALVDTEVAGQRIAAGEFIVPVVAAANYDPDKFSDPMSFNIRRHPNPHLAFGAGIHVCIGNMLARMVAPRAISALVRAFPNMRMLDDGRDVATNLFAIRGLKSLPVSSGIDP
jgi:cytochrome P450